jgi:hypothetical protein
LKQAKFISALSSMVSGNIFGNASCLFGKNLINTRRESSKGSQLSEMEGWRKLINPS